MNLSLLVITAGDKRMYGADTNVGELVLVSDDDPKNWNKLDNLFGTVVNPKGITDSWRLSTRLLAGLMACMALFLFEDKHS